jgi:hypothetical protein
LIAGGSTAATFDIPKVLKAPNVPAIDLDIPGALEALEREHPDRFSEVMKAVEKASKLPPLESGASLRRALVDETTRGGQLFMPTYPAKRHIFVLTDGVEYKISAYFTEDPARLHKAR